MNPGNRSHARRNAIIGAAIAVITVLASLATIAEFIRSQPGTPSSVTSAPTATQVPPLDCPQGVVTTIRSPNPPPSRLTVKIRLDGHENGGGSPAPTTYAEIDIRCDGDTVQFNQGEVVDCNGIVLRFDDRLGGGVYIGDIPPIAVGGSYVCKYKQSSGQVFRIPLAGMPQPAFVSPTDGAAVRIPKSSPLSIQFTPGGSNDYVLSAKAEDSEGNTAFSPECGDTGACSIEAALFNTPEPTLPPGFPTPAPGTPNGVFVPGPGHITLSRLFISANYQVSGTAFGAVTLDYVESSTISVNWTQR